MSETAIEKHGLHEFGGTFNYRLIRGSASSLSNHAFAIAIDLSPAKNPLGSSRGKMPKLAIDAFKRQGARWGGDYRGRKDPMHFEFVSPASRRLRRRAQIMSDRCGVRSRRWCSWGGHRCWGARCRRATVSPARIMLTPYTDTRLGLLNRTYAPEQRWRRIAEAALLTAAAWGSCRRHGCSRIDCDFL